MSHELNSGCVPITLMDDIDATLKAMRYEAEQQGNTLHPPVLAMGISERVGSNWFGDTIQAVMMQHNEPFRQQLAASHRLSPLAPYPLLPDEYFVNQMHPYERYWLTAFVAAKYGTEQQLIKETNLFFATDTFLRLFPESPVIALARNPVGVASSFAKGDLYRKWEYQERYDQLLETTSREAFTAYRPILEGNSLDQSHKVGRLVALNTLLLAEALEGRDYLTIQYEDAVADHGPILRQVSSQIFGNDTLLHAYTPPSSVAESQADSTFSTRRQLQELTAHLTGDEMQSLHEDIAARLQYIDDTFAPSVAQRVREFLEPGFDAYVAEPSIPKHSSLRKKPASPEVTQQVEARFVRPPGSKILWRNLLVSNHEFCAFLNDMQTAGQSNVLHGTSLFFNENMIESRGGRIHTNSNGGYEVSAGYEQYPVYWVTWLGAAAFARYAGARLPAKDELEQLFQHSNINFNIANTDYKVGDVVSVVDPTADLNAIHHTVGNLMIWLADSLPDEQALGGPSGKYWQGTAWNNPGTLKELYKLKSRHVTGSSRSAGVRLVRSPDTMYAPEQPAVIVQRIQRAFQELERIQSTPFTELDHRFEEQF